MRDFADERSEGARSGETRGAESASIGPPVGSSRAPSAAGSAHADPIFAYFGQDITDYGVLRRIAGFEAAGVRVLACTFWRHRDNCKKLPDRADILLGETADGDHLGRLWQLVGATRVIWSRRRQLSPATVFYVRNLDMAVLGWFAQTVSRSKSQFVYEVLDVHPRMLGKGVLARLLRWAERRVLAHAQLLVVSSPGYINHYFVPAQRYGGKWFLLENKLVAATLREDGPYVRGKAKQKLDAIKGQRLIIGWFGKLRCSRSLSMLARLCEALPEKVMVYARGYPTSIDPGIFHKVISQHPNLIFDGEFSFGELPDIYDAVDFVWNFDYFLAGGTSDWLLSNRIYQSGFFGVPALASSRTQTGRRIEELGMGWTFSEPVEQHLSDFLDRVTPQELSAMKAHMASLPRNLFCDENDVRRLVVTCSPGAAQKWSGVLEAEAPRISGPTGSGKFGGQGSPEFD